MTKVLGLFIDALSDQYLSPRDTPTLWRWSEQQGHAELAPLFAFHGVAASMYTGAPPARTGVWTDFIIDPAAPGNKPDALQRALGALPDGFPRKAAITAYERIVKRSHVTPHRIPVDLRPFYVPILTAGWADREPVPGFPTVFDVHQDAGRTVHLRGLGGGIQSVLTQGMPHLATRREDLVLYKVNTLDAIGHGAGPGSSELRAALRKIDRQIARTVERNGDKEVIVFSDHGMTPTKSAIDLRALVRAGTPELTEGVDYVPFYNSTCALFRWMRDGAREVVVAAIAEDERVRFLTADDRSSLSIGDAPDAYADDVVVTEPGHVIAPDFYTTKARAGMHGYATTTGECAVVFSPDRELRANGHMWDIAPTLLEAAGLAEPSTNEGTSLYK